MKTILCSVTLYVLTSLFFSAPVFGDKHVPSPEETLAAYGIGLDVDDLTAALSASNPLVREASARVLGDRSVKSVIPQLLGLLEDQYPYARLAGARALAKMGQDRGRQALQDLAKSSEVPIAARANAELLSLGDTSACDSLLSLIRVAKVPMDRVVITRTVAPCLSVRDKQKLAISALTDLMLNDVDSRVRQAAASELRKTEGLEVRDAFARATEDQDPVVKGLARDYLESHR